MGSTNGSTLGSHWNSGDTIPNPSRPWGRNDFQVKLKLGLILSARFRSRWMSENETARSFERSRPVQRLTRDVQVSRQATDPALLARGLARLSPCRPVLAQSGKRT